MANLGRRYRRRRPYLVYEDTYTISQREAADILGVPLSRLAAWRRRCEGPFWIKLGRYIRYSYADLMPYLPGQDCASSS